MPIRYHIALPDPKLARGTDPELSFRSHGADGLAAELEDALRGGGLFDRWREQIGPGNAPQHLANRARGNTGSKECRGCAIDSAIPTTRDLVQTAKSQPASREDPIDFRNAKG